MDVLESHASELPQLTLWERETKGKKLKIINPNDFPKDQILMGVGLSQHPLAHTFGITDRDEILARQSLIKFFMDNPMMVDFLDEEHFDFGLPTTESAFLHYFQKGQKYNPYWKSVMGIISLVENGKEAPKRLRELIDVLKLSTPLAEDEQKMGAFIAEKIIKMAVIEGLVECDLSLAENPQNYKKKKKSGKVTERLYWPVTGLSELSIKAFGHTEHSFDMANFREKPYPDWSSNPFNPLRWIAGWWIEKRIDRSNETKKRKAYDQMIIEEASPSLIRDIRKGLIHKLNKMRFTRPIHRGAVIKARFFYSNHGLQIQIYGIELYKNYPHIGDFTHDNFAGYDAKKEKDMQAITASFRNKAREYQKAMVNVDEMNNIKKRYPRFFDVMLTVDSKDTDKRYRWFAINNLYRSETCREVWSAAEKHRTFLSRHITTLRDIADIAVTMKEQAKKLNTQVCFPEIVDDSQHVVAFDEIYPIHLISSQEKSPRPIKDMVPLNGQIIALTGYHGGGKTVTSLSLGDNIFLAQSGLPVFGKGFKLNLKDALGLVFIERGNGSTCEMLLDKINLILKGVSDLDTRKIVLILDELGSATQEDSGYELGMDLLVGLAESKASVICSTQIQDLAKSIEKDLGGVCYKFDANHVMTPGIGDGGMSDLRKRKGIDKSLKKLEKANRT